MTEGTPPASPESTGPPASVADAARPVPARPPPRIEELFGPAIARRSRRSPPPALLPALGVAAAYVAAALAVYHRVVFAPASSLPGCNCGDQAQEVWFLRWPLYAVSHGLNPFYSTWMNTPKGINLAVNTSSPLLGLASAPLQLTIGTVAAFDVLLVVALATSALAMCLALRRWVRSWVAAFLGGLLYGFSPYMVGQGSGHLFLVALFIPPILLVVLDETVVVQRHGAVVDGLLLGLLLALEYYISPEVLAMTIVVAVCGVALLAVTRPRAVTDRAPHVVVAAVCAAVVCGAAIAYPVWMSLHGPQHVVGPPHPLKGLSGFRGDLLGPVLPTSNQLLAPASLKAHGDALVGHDPSENGMYLGVPLVIVLAVFAWVYRRRGALLFFVAMVVVAGVLSLGPHLVVDTRDTGVPLPAWVLQHLPFVKDILDVRFSLFIQLAAAAALAIGLDEMVAAARSWAEDWSPHRWGRLGGIGAPAAVAVVALAPLIPAAPYPAGAVSAPPFFTSTAVDRIPAGAAVLTYPYPLRPSAEWNMTFQVEAGLRFKIFGGDAFVPGPTGTSVSPPEPLVPRVVEHLFSDAYTPSSAKTALGTAPGTPTPPVDRATVAALRTFLRRYHVSAVVVDDLGAHPKKVVRYVTDALGPPVKTGGVWAWFDVPGLLSRTAAR